MRKQGKCENTKLNPINKDATRFRCETILSNVPCDVTTYN